MEPGGNDALVGLGHVCPLDERPMWGVAARALLRLLPPALPLTGYGVPAVEGQHSTCSQMSAEIQQRALPLRIKDVLDDIARQHGNIEMLGRDGAAVAEDPVHGIRSLPTPRESKHRLRRV